MVLLTFGGLVQLRVTEYFKEGREPVVPVPGKGVSPEEHRANRKWYLSSLVLLAPSIISLPPFLTPVTPGSGIIPGVCRHSKT